MKHMRIVTTVFAVLAFALFAVPVKAQQAATAQQEAAQIAVSLGFLTFQAHVFKGNLTATDTKIETTFSQIINEYEESINNMTFRQLQNGQMPEFSTEGIEKLTEALIANQHELSSSEIDMNAAKEATKGLIQTLLFQQSMAGLMQ